MRNLIKKILNESLKNVYITDESYSCLVTEDEGWILLRNNNMAKNPIPTLIKTDNLDVNTLSSCYMINDRMLELNWRHFKRASKVFLKDTMGGPSTTVDNNFKLKIVKFKDGMVLDKPVDTHSLFESEDDFGWVDDIIPTNFDYSPGVVYHKFGRNDEVKKYVIKKLIDIQFNDVKLVGDKVILETDGWCDFTGLFYEDRRGSDGYINRYIADKMLCEDGDWWEPYHASDLIGRRNWKSMIWDGLVINNQKVLDAVLNHIKKNYVSSVNYNPKQLDVFGELPKKQNVVKINNRVLDSEYFSELKNNLNELGDLIDDENEFSDLKNELRWAYGEAYNTVTRDQIWLAVKGAIEGYFGQGTWQQKEVQPNAKHYSGGPVTKHYMEFDITDLFWDMISKFFDDCYQNCNPPEDLSLEDLEDECSECNYPDYSSFISFMTQFLSDSNGELQPRYQEYPNDNDVEKYFVESVIERI